MRNRRERWRDLHTARRRQQADFKESKDKEPAKEQTNDTEKEKGKK